MIKKNTPALRDTLTCDTTFDYSHEISTLWNICFFFLNQKKTKRDVINRPGHNTAYDTPIVL